MIPKNQEFPRIQQVPKKIHDKREIYDIIIIVTII